MRWVGRTGSKIVCSSERSLAAGGWNMRRRVVSTTSGSLLTLPKEVNSAWTR